ncbi:MAG: GNAT family N-acetyltransferase [Oscillospiraceae bacterium]|nr:GNAT family N-acetyltransferase [Oscillospiraceae bacterium]
MSLSEYEQKYVRIRTIYGDTLTGLARYGDCEFLRCEWGGEEEGLFIEDFLVYRSQIESIEEIEVHGTVELWTDRMILRRYRPEDAEPLHRGLGTDPTAFPYAGRNPYATPETARETVRQIIESSRDEHFYAWVMDIEDVVVGTIGARPLEGGRTEVGFNIVRGWRGRGLAAEALKKVLEYLTKNEGISCVTASCAPEDGAARRALEKAGMRLVRAERDGRAGGGEAGGKALCSFRFPCE